MRAAVVDRPAASRGRRREASYPIRHHNPGPAPTGSLARFAQQFLQAHHFLISGVQYRRNSGFPALRTSAKPSFAARHIPGVPVSRFARLERLGLLRRVAGGYDLDELREDLELIEGVEQRIAAVDGDLSSVERNGALAWLAAATRARERRDRPALAIADMIEQITALRPN